jgi:hypothetical protein
VVACATGPLSENLIEQAVTTTVERTHQRELHWFSDGWRGYQSILVRAYRQRKLTGKRGRPPWVIPEALTLMQTVKHRDEHGRLLSVETRAALGAGMEPAGTMHVERLNGALRDRLNALTRKTHAFAKRDACNGYLDHPFKNMLLETEKDLLSRLANTAGLMYNQSSSASTCSNDTMLM